MNSETETSAPSRAPDVEGWLLQPDPDDPTRGNDPTRGTWLKVRVWLPTVAPVAPLVWQAWLFIEGSSYYDPPAHVSGGSRLQASMLVFQEITTHCEATGAIPATRPSDGARP